MKYNQRIVEMANYIYKYKPNVVRTSNSKEPIEVYSQLLDMLGEPDYDKWSKYVQKQNNVEQVK